MGQQCIPKMLTMDSGIAILLSVESTLATEEIVRLICMEIPMDQAVSTTTQQNGIRMILLIHLTSDLSMMELGFMVDILNLLNWVTHLHLTIVAVTLMMVYLTIITLKYIKRWLHIKGKLSNTPHSLLVL